MQNNLIIEKSIMKLNLFFYLFQIFFLIKLQKIFNLSVSFLMIFIKNKLILFFKK